MSRALSDEYWRGCQGLTLEGMKNLAALSGCELFVDNQGRVVVWIPRGPIESCHCLGQQDVQALIDTVVSRVGISRVGLR